MKTIQKLVAVVMAGALVSGCASTTLIRSTDPNAKIFIDGELKGTGTATHTDTKIVGSTTQYQWRRALDAAAPQPDDTTVALYRSTLRGTISGHCTLLPSESTLAQWRFGRCGIATTVVASMARWLLEPDAAHLGLPVVVAGDRLYFAQLPPTCWPLER